MSTRPSRFLRWRSPGQDASAEEAAFDAFASTQDPMDIAAARWAARRRDGLDPQGRTEFQAWLAADPRHAQRLDEMQGLFGEITQATGDEIAALRASLPAGAAPAPRPAIGPAPPFRGTATRRRVVSFAAAAVFACTVLGAGWSGWTYWRALPVFEQAYATATGQQSSIILPDAEGGGTRIYLDTATRIDVRLYRDRREVHLKDGQAQFSVTPDARRPLHVQSGPVDVTVVGTRFSVRHAGTGLAAGQTVVSVEEGHVRLGRIDAATDGARGPGSAGGPSLDLVAGQRAVVNAQGVFGPIATVPPAAMTAWREGRLGFDQTPLGEAIAEFERYGSTGLFVRDPAVAALPVGGSYSLNQAGRFMESLPRMLPIRLVRRGERTEVVAR